MDKEKFAQAVCPLEYATNVIGGKWKLRIIWILSQSEYVRFNELKRNLNSITDIMLTKSLKDLVQDDIVKRVQYNEIPPRVEYSLTENGMKLIDALTPIRKWSEGTLKSMNHCTI